MVPTGPLQKRPGVGEQVAKKVGSKVVADQAAKLGLNALGQSVAGPLGGYVGTALGDLAGPLAGDLIGSLFQKGGPVYAQQGGRFRDWWGGLDAGQQQGYTDTAKQYLSPGDYNLETYDDYTGGEHYDTLQNIYGDTQDSVHDQFSKDITNYAAADAALAGAKTKEEVFDAFGDLGKSGNVSGVYLAQQAAKKIQALAKAGVPPEKAKEIVKKEIEKPKPAPVDRAVGGSRGVSGTWNVPLGNVGGWDLSTQGHITGDLKRKDGTREKGNWGAHLKASKPSSLLSDIFGGNTQEKLAESARINRELDKNAGPTSSSYWRAQGLTDENEIMDKVMEAAGFEHGGKVHGKKKSIWGTIKDKITSDYSRRQQLFGQGRMPPKNEQKPAYRYMGGMTPGPLGMTDVQALGRPSDVSKVMYKKKGGDVEDTVEINYHPPLKYQQPKGE